MMFGEKFRASRCRPVLLMAAALMPLSLLVRQQAELTAMWPTWRIMLGELALLTAGAVLVAGVAAGLVAWQRARP